MKAIMLSSETMNNLGVTGVQGVVVEDRAMRTRGGRSLRDRKYRRVFGENRDTKRLFTPEIKKFLKGWLVRRRKNPYPNRSEKKELALKTGLTYLQICNWFANWRRKLKKSSHDAGTAGTWGRLITCYNRQAHGNLEQISISSKDSIWDEANFNHAVNITVELKSSPCPAENTCLDTETSASITNRASPSPLTDSSRVEDNNWEVESSQSPAPTLIKWLESAARFRPRQVRWGPPPLSWSCSTPLTRKPKNRVASVRRRHREELDAAEALTYLSRSCRGQCV